jgi:DNA adenine methylase
MGLFDELNDVTSKHKDILRSPFPYPGGKSRSIQYILPEIPYKNTYVEPFGGSGAVLLARQPSKLEVFNDRFSGVVAFYQCMRDPIKYEKLIDWLKLTIHSREDFELSKEWENHEDTVCRAGLWYYCVNYSFSSLGRNWGRCISGNGNLSGKIVSKLKNFPKIHARMRNVQIENQDWRSCIRDYDRNDAVFYLDPPYLDAQLGSYRFNMSHDDHRELLDTVFNMDAYVALSSYRNNLYDSYDWDDIITWESYVSLSPKSFTCGNHKENLDCFDKRVNAEECLYIKK